MEYHIDSSGKSLIFNPELYQVKLAFERKAQNKDIFHHSKPHKVYPADVLIILLEDEFQQVRK